MKFDLYYENITSKTLIYPFMIHRIID